MKTLLLLAFLAAAAFCLCHAADVDADAAAAAQANGPKKDSEAFVSRKESAQVVHRNKKRGDRLLQALSGPAVTPDPLEPFREVCETNPSCDELADQIGFQEAYRRFYRPI